MRHVKVFEAHGANYRRVGRTDHKLLDIWLTGSRSRIDGMLQSAGLKTGWYGEELEQQSRLMGMEVRYMHHVPAQKAYDCWDTRLFVSVAGLEDDYWLLSIVVVIDSVHNGFRVATWPSDRLVDMHLICDDIAGLEMAVKGPLAEIIARMDKIDAEYKSLRSNVHGLGDGINTEG